MLVSCEESAKRRAKNNENDNDGNDYYDEIESLKQIIRDIYNSIPGYKAIYNVDVCTFRTRMQDIQKFIQDSLPNEKWDNDYGDFKGNPLYLSSNESNSD